MLIGPTVAEKMNFNAKKKTRLPSLDTTITMDGGSQIDIITMDSGSQIEIIIMEKLSKHILGVMLLKLL